MIVEKIEMLAGEPGDLRQRIVHTLRVERSAPFKERILVAEIAVLRTSTTDHDRVGNEIQMPVDQIAADRRDSFERAVRRRDISLCGAAGPEVLEKSWKRLLARPQKDCVCVPGGLVGKRCHVQSAQGDECAARTIVVSKRVSATGAGDI